MKRIAIVLVLILAWAAPSLAQTYLTTTTLVNAITTTTQSSIVVLSASTIEVGGMLYMDHEAMGVLSVSGTLIGVSRGQQGTAAAPHAAGTAANGGATVIIAPKAALAGSGPYGLSAFGQSDPPAGVCTTAPYRYLPIVNVVTGNVWSCRWVGTGTQTAKVWAATNIVSINGQTSIAVQ